MSIESEAAKILAGDNGMTIQDGKYETIKIYDSSMNLMPINFTEKEFKDKINELKNALPMKSLRRERNRRLLETDEWALRAMDGPSMTQEQKDYRQALRDLPLSTSPQLDEFGRLTNVTWPTKPE
tara:strand:+ start:526 stop:900 length:375 start_codon:yes stop_codon:yes gene_type:complete